VWYLTADSKGIDESMVTSTIFESISFRTDYPVEAKHKSARVSLTLLERTKEVLSQVAQFPGIRSVSSKSTVSTKRSTVPQKKKGNNQNEGPHIKKKGSIKKKGRSSSKRSALDLHQIRSY